MKITRDELRFIQARRMSAADVGSMSDEELNDALNNFYDVDAMGVDMSKATLDRALEMEDEMSRRSFKIAADFDWNWAIRDEENTYLSTGMEPDDTTVGGYRTEPGNNQNHYWFAHDAFFENAEDGYANSPEEAKAAVIAATKRLSPSVGEIHAV